MTDTRPRCRCCRRPLKDPTAVARKTGHDCWQSLAPAEREQILAALPREFRPTRLRARRIPRRHRPDNGQPPLFELPAQPQPEELETTDMNGSGDNDD